MRMVENEAAECWLGCLYTRCGEMGFSFALSHQLRNEQEGISYFHG